MTLEAALSRPVSRYELFDFARKGKGRGSGGIQPPRRPIVNAPVPQPEPDWNPFNRLTTRRALVGGGVVGGVTGLGLAVADRLGLLKLFPQGIDYESQSPESLVSQARKIEDGFKGNDLSDSIIREDFTKIIAAIYSKDAPSAWTSKQMTDSIIWARNLDEFVKSVNDNSTRKRPPRGRDYFVTTPAITTDNNRVVINVANQAFNTSILRKAGFPPDWNGLKSLRRLILHEFVHLTSITRDGREFLVLTDIPQNVENPLIGGFAFSYDEAGRGREAFHPLNESAVETITDERNIRLFGSSPRILFEDQGVEVSSAQKRLRSILDVAGITVRQLEKYNRESDLVGFISDLSSRANLPSDMPTVNRINYALDILDAVMFNNQVLMQSYIDRVRSSGR